MAERLRDPTVRGAGGFTIQRVRGRVASSRPFHRTSSYIGPEGGTLASSTGVDPRQGGEPVIAGGKGREPGMKRALGAANGADNPSRHAPGLRAPGGSGHRGRGPRGDHWVVVLAG